MNNTPQKETAQSGSALRVVSAIEFLAANQGGRIEDVAQALGIHKSNASRLLAALREADWVTANETRTWFTLSSRLAAVGQAARGRGIMEIATAIAIEIRNKVGESVHLSIPDLRTLSMLVTACFDSPSILRVSQPVGSRDPLHSTAVGKIYLSSLPESELQALLPKLAAEIDATSGAEFIASFTGELEQARHDGFAINNQESREGVVGGAILLAPREKNLHAPIALSVTGPATRWSATEARTTMQELVKIYSNDISRSH